MCVTDWHHIKKTWQIRLNQELCLIKQYKITFMYVTLFQCCPSPVCFMSVLEWKVTAQVSAASIRAQQPAVYHVPAESWGHRFINGLVCHHELWQILLLSCISLCSYTKMHNEILKKGKVFSSLMRCLCCQPLPWALLTTLPASVKNS